MILVGLPGQNCHSPRSKYWPNTMRCIFYIEKHRKLFFLDFLIAVLTFRCLHGLAPPYLASDLQLVSGVESRRRLRSADRQQLVVPSSNRKTIGDRAFTVAAPRVLNSLSSATTSLQSVPAFRKALKTELDRSAISRLTDYSRQNAGLLVTVSDLEVHWI